MGLPWDFRPLAGDRIRLELLRDDDFEALYALQSDPGRVRYMLYDPRSPEKVAERLAADAAAARLGASGDYIQPAIRDEAGTLLGTLYFRLAEPDGNAEIGWLLAPSAEGKGYATEAASLMLDIAFGEIGVHRVFAELDPRNSASVGVCRRLGMRHEGHFVEHMFMKGEWTDTGHYAILGREWRGRS